MCGICGIFDAEGQAPAQQALLRRMSDSLAHRGPDNDGFHIAAHCGLGHRRLKIIDLSPLGKQPMTNEDESLWLSFNGEIYNYLELRPELVKRGHRFRSQSDTEVMLHLYEDEGEDFLKLLNGMFALSLWDERRKRLILARDRFGKKPLYYYNDGRRLLFGSELKALLADPSVPRELNLEALSTYLALGYVPCPATIFKNIHKLPPASHMVVERSDEGRVRLRGPQRYWNLKYRPDAKLTEGDCVARIRELVRDAVRIRMFSDVPLGAFLSGGVDSSTVVAAMAGVSQQPVETFSIGFDQSSFDELPYAEQVAKQFGTRHHTFQCTPDALEVLPTLVHHFDEPFADSSAIPTYYVSKIARQQVTVALSGDGGDEVFAGYTRYDNGMQRQGWSRLLPEPVIRAAFRIATELYPVGSRGWGILHRNSLAPLDSYMADVSLFQPREKRKLLSEALRVHGNGNVFGLARSFASQTGSDEFLSQMQYVDEMLYLPDDILVKVDRASMAVALETRAPLLDYRLAEFMATVPAGLRMRNGEKKYLLRRAMRGMLPDAILDRPKRGFTVPIARWFTREAGAFARETLTSRAVRERGLFHPSEVDRLVARLDSDRRVVAEKVWALLFFELWCQRWLDAAPSAPPAEPAEVTSCSAS